MEKIYYSCINSPIGTIWAATTKKGLCQVHLSSSKNFFINELRKRVKTKIIPSDNKLENFRILINKYFNGETVMFDLPLDMRGTQFQIAIWNEICKIPYGKLSSYGRLTKAIGKPKASRAVGNATGTNHLGIIVPCHRVIKSDGGIGGFGGRVYLKEYLLSLEGVIPPTKTKNKDLSKRRYVYKKKDLKTKFYC